jgi:hypothetical protein
MDKKSINTISAAISRVLTATVAALLLAAVGWYESLRT